MNTFEAPIVSTASDHPTHAQTTVTAAIYRNDTFTQCAVMLTVNTLATYFEWTQLTPSSSVDDGYLPPYFGVTRVPSELTPAVTDKKCAAYFSRGCATVPVATAMPKAALSASSSLSLAPLSLTRESVYLFQLQAITTLRYCTATIKTLVECSIYFTLFSRCEAWYLVSYFVHLLCSPSLTLPLPSAQPVLDRGCGCGFGCGRCQHCGRLCKDRQYHVACVGVYLRWSGLCDSKQRFFSTSDASGFVHLHVSLAGADFGAS